MAPSVEGINPTVTTRKPVWRSAVGGFILHVPRLNKAVF